MARILFVWPSEFCMRCRWVIESFSPTLTLASDDSISVRIACHPSRWYSLSQSLESRARSHQARHVWMTLMRAAGSRYESILRQISGGSVRIKSIYSLGL